MPRHSTRTCALAVGLALAGATAMAQTPTAASAPAAVGVTPGTAAAATQKAVPRSDTATLVRTGPTAADKAKDVRDGAMRTGAGDASGSASGVGNGMPSTRGNTAGGMTRAAGSDTLPPRPDRN